MTLKSRLTSLIDQANAVLDAGFVLPCKIEALTIECDGRMVSVWVRFDSGMLSQQVIAATPMDVCCLINAVHCAFLADFLDLQIDEDGDDPDLTAYATGYQPTATTEDGKDITHAAPGVIQ